MAVREGAAPQCERGQVDQAVAWRHKRRDVVQPVDVDAQPAGEHVLHGRGEDHDDGDLDARRSALATQSERQEQPGAGAEQPLQCQ
jgi:hypothetical protein